jgi:hypothetical protein
MGLTLETNDILDSIKNISKELELEKNFYGIKEQFEKVVTNTIDKTATYTIKAMPIPDAFKDILYDIKESFKSKDFKEIIKTVINSSVREGLEFLGLDSKKIKNLTEIKEVCSQGGLMYGVKAGIEIMEKKYLKNNIVGEYVYDFFSELKNSPLNKNFTNKMENKISKLDEAKTSFLNKCENFKQAYESFNLEDIKKTAYEVEKSFNKVKKDAECIRQNKIIQNIFTLVNNKKEKLTDAQLELCNMV